MMLSRLSPAARRLFVLSSTLSTGAALTRYYSTSTVAASTTQPQVSQFYFEGHGHLIPHPAKKQKGGEDRFVISESMLAVFDGVSGWASHGVDPAAYPTSLAKFVEEYLKSDKDKRNKGFAFRALQYAWELSTKVTGSTTACLVSLTNEDKLDTLNLGDSGFMIIRNDAIVHRSKEQQHQFNMPYQIGTSGDKPKDGKQELINVSEGDLLLLGTDGLFDNVFDEEILKMVVQSKVREQKGKYDQLAKSIALRAEKLSNSETYESPFSVSARQVGYQMLGGKPDDITVVIAQIKRRQPTS